MSQGFAQGLSIPVPVIQGGTGLSGTTINQILYSSANNVIAGLPTVNSSLLTTSAGGTPIWSALTGFANAPVNTNITSMTGLTGSIKAPTAILDSSSNTMIGLSNLTPSGTNYINISNAVGNPRITAIGTSSNVAINLFHKNSQITLADSTGTIGGVLTFNNATNNNWTSLTVDPLQATTVTFRLPSADGVSGSALWTNGTGTWSFANNINSNITQMTALNGTLRAPVTISSAAGADVLGFSYTPSAVNNVLIGNNVTGTAPFIICVSGTDANVTLSLQGKGTGTAAIKGTGTNDNAPAGFVGEFVSSVVLIGSAVTFTNNTPTNITSISLTAGDWDVWGNVTWSGLATNTSQVIAWTNNASATTPSSEFYIQIALTTAGAVLSGGTGLNPPYRRYSLASTTTIYLSGITVATSAGSSTAFGGIYARRAR